jgi:predicted naringenin-chalcone synthase
MPAYLSHIGCAVPSHSISQQNAVAFMLQALDLQGDDARRLRALYRASGIQRRHSVLPDYHPAHAGGLFGKPGQNASTATRMELYRREAPQLAEQAVRQSFPPDFDWASITHLVVVSCTGMYAPGLDIDLVHRLGLPWGVHRTAVQFMGCYAAVNALKVAADACLAHAGARVLLVDVELCTLHFQPLQEDDQLLANALFADGAAAALVSGRPIPGGKRWRIDGFFAGLIPKGASDMAWQIGDWGFEMRLSSYVPRLLADDMERLAGQALAHYGLPAAEVAHWAVHPGGKRILDAVSQALALPRQALQASWGVLENYGNMSSATILFVLKALQERESHGPCLAMAFGPGLTLETARLTLETEA